MSEIASLFSFKSDISLSNFFRMGENFVLQYALWMFDRGLNPPIYFVYFGVIVMMFMSWCAAAYNVGQVVTAGVSFTDGFYHDYANYSTTGNLMYFWEVLAITNQLLWSFVVIILSLVAGSQLWELMDQRYLESLEKKAGAETPLTWDKSVRNFLVAIIAGLTTIISGVSLGESAYEMISWFDQYDDNTNNEACDKRNDSGNCDPSDTPGTAASWDISAHLIAVFYGQFVLGLISIGGYIFMMSFIGFDDDFDCEFVDGIDQSHYLPIFGQIVNMRNYDECMAQQGIVPTILDLNGDGFVSRCEDAQFQYTMGETREYAMKFSAPFTLDSISKVCGKLFPFF